MKLEVKHGAGSWRTVMTFATTELLVVQGIARELFSFSDQKSVLRTVHDDGYPHAFSYPPFRKWEPAKLSPRPQETYR